MSIDPLVDTQGLLLKVLVFEADLQDRTVAPWLLLTVHLVFSRLQLIWADGGYSGELVTWVQRICGWTLEIVKRSDNRIGFQVLPRRWVVERTFGWLNRWRRLSKDYEVLPQTSQALIYATMSLIMTRRLARL
jgi:putative transposase